MQKADAIQIASKYFPSYPTVNTFFVSSDGQCFENETHATNHGNSFKKEADKEIIKVTREEATEQATATLKMNPDDENANKVISGNDDQAKLQAEKDAAIKFAEDEVITLGKAVKTKQSVLNKAADADKAAAQNDLNTAQAQLTVAEAKLNELLAAG